MNVQRYAIDADGTERLDAEGQLSDVVSPDDEEYYSARNALETVGRYWLGGGAAQLFYLRRAD